MYYFLLILSFVTLSYGVILPTKPEQNSLVIYNANLALVHEVKSLSLSPTDKQIIYPDVARSIISNSVSIKLSQSVVLYTQQYRYDKLTQTKLLDAYIGKEVAYKHSQVILLAHQGKEAIVRDINGSIKMVNTQDISLKSVPKELILHPSLVWNVQTKKSIETKITLDYLIRNIRWHSDYVVHLAQDYADITGWITLDNNSGKAFRDTQLYLLAGDINRVTNPQSMPVRYMKAMVRADSASVVEKPYEGYHIYSVGFHVDIANNEKTQIKFLTKYHVGVKRVYSAYLNNPLYIQGEIKSVVKQAIDLDKLDIPLPKGVVRTYATHNQTDILLGETDIKHTPKNTPIKLQLGTHFDLHVTQTELEREKRGDYRFVKIRYSLKNATDTAKKITLYIPFNKKKSSTIHSGRSFHFTHGNKATFSVDVRANSSLSFDVAFETKK